VENLGDTTYDAVYIGVKGKLATASNGATDPAPPTKEETQRMVAEYFLSSGKP
jgi:hypothetical protein